MVKFCDNFEYFQVSMNVIHPRKYNKTAITLQRVSGISFPLIFCWQRLGTMMQVAEYDILHSNAVIHFVLKTSWNY